MAALEAAMWPGNVRELQHAVERAVAVNAGTPIAAHDLALAAIERIHSDAGGEVLPFREARERFEREYFANVLRAAKGNVSEAARISGIARQNLHSRVTKLRSS
jgi:two-component system response regulator HydG